MAPEQGDLLDLIDDPVVVHPPEEPATLDERFRLFHERYPWVFDRLRRMALDLRNRGHEKVSIAMLYEVLRWELMTATDLSPDSAGCRLNNSLRSRYARLLMHQVPGLEGAFETRELRSDR